MFSWDMHGMRILLPYDSLLYNPSVRTRMTMYIIIYQLVDTFGVEGSYDLDGRTAVTFNLS